MCVSNGCPLLLGLVYQAGPGHEGDTTTFVVFSEKLLIKVPLFG